MSDRDEPRGQVPEVTPLDELASALLDDEATVEERARAADPEVAARVARFTEIAAIVGAEPAPATAGQRDAAVAAALAAWDAGEPVPSVERPTDELAERRPRTHRALRLVGVAAAAVAVIGLGAALVDRLPEGSDDDASVAADTSEESTATEETFDSSAGADAPALDDSERLPGPVSGGDIGEFDNLESLLFETAARTAGDTAPAGAGSGADNQDAAEFGIALACAPAALAAGDPATVLTATLDQRDVVVVALATPEGPRVVVIDAATCAVLADRTP